MNSHIYKCRLLEKILPVFIAILAFIYQGPYFLWNQPPYIYRIVLLTTIVTVFVYFMGKKISFRFFLPAFCFTVSWLFRQFSSNGIEPWFSFEIILIMIFIFCDDKVKMNSFKWFMNIYTISLIPSIVMYFMVFAGWNLPWVFLEPLNPLKTAVGEYYREYWGMVVLSSEIVQLGVGEMFRLSGMFDEPGVVGTISAILLVATNFSMHEWRGKILLISGLFSFSLAFYVICALFLFLRRPFYVFNSFLVILFIVALLPPSILGNDLVRRYLLERVATAVYDFDSVNNRETDGFKAHYKKFLSSESILFGCGKKSSISARDGSASYKVTIYTYGYLGFLTIFIYYLSFVVIQIRNISDVFRLAPFLLCCFASLLQRPLFDTFGFILMYCGGAASILSVKKPVWPSYPIKCELIRK